MRCYFMRSGRIVDVEILSGLSDDEAVAKAKLLFSERPTPTDGFEVWDRARIIFKHQSESDANGRSGLGVSGPADVGKPGEDAAPEALVTVVVGERHA
jgi:hypothetical protein